MGNSGLVAPNLAPSERREAQRWELFSRCRFIWEEKTLEAKVLDLSSNGAFLESAVVPSEGSPIQLTFLADETGTKLECKVVHGGQFVQDFRSVQGFGVEFSQPPVALIERIQHLQHTDLPAPNTDIPKKRRIQLSSARLARHISDINKEIWLVLSLIFLSICLNFLVDANRMALWLFTLPALFSAYLYGRRHATMTAFASVFLVALFGYFKPLQFNDAAYLQVSLDSWLELMLWSCTLVITAYAMGTLYEKKEKNMRELRQTYQGVLVILQHFISKDKYTQNHSYRVSVYAGKIASAMGLDESEVEDVQTAALLHDIGKLEIGREILYKASNLTEEEFDTMKKHVKRGVSLLEPVGGSLRRVIPIILAHHERYDGSGYHSTSGRDIPLGARVIAVADSYDAMTSDRPYRKGMAPLEAKEIIIKGMGKDFDPQVVKTFVILFRRGELEVPEILV